MKRNACIIISAVMMGMTVLPPSDCILPGLSATAEAASVKLDAPTGARTSAKYRSGSYTVTLRWDKVKGADGYQVYIYDEAKGKFVAYKKVKGTTALYNDADATVTYRFKVAAYKKSSSGIVCGKLSKEFLCESTEVEEEPPEEFDIVPTVGKTSDLEAPKNIRLIKATANSLTLKWDVVPGADRYYVEYFSDSYRRSAEEEDADFVRNLVTCDTNSITVKDLETDEKYAFIVYAAEDKQGDEVNGKRSGEMLFSTEGVVTKPSSPSSARFSYFSGQYGVISWNSPENTDSFTYALYEGDKCICSERTTETAAALTGLKKDTTYSFRVAASNKKGSSEYYHYTFSTSAQKDRLPDPEAYGYELKTDFPFYNGNIVFGKTCSYSEIGDKLTEGEYPDNDYVKHMFDNGLKPKNNRREYLKDAKLPNLIVTKIVICRDGKDLYEYYTCCYFKDRDNIELRLVIKVL